MTTLTTQLEQLENAQFLRRAPGEDLSYLFQHALMQDTAYESLLMKKRRAIHRLVAQAYEQTYSERLDEYASLLAQHYAEARDDAKTLEYATRAGDLAARVYANAEAILQYTRALDAANHSPSTTAQLVHLYTRRGRAYELSGEYEQALANYEEMESLAHMRGDQSLELESLMLRAIIRSTPTVVFDAALAQALGDRALALARDLGNSAAEARVLWILGLRCFFTGHSPEAVEYGERSLALARQFDLREQMAFTLNNLSYPYISVGQSAKSIAAPAEASELWRELDNQPMLADSLANLAQHEFLLGEFDRTLDYSAQALHISQNIGSLWGQSFSKFFTGYVFWERGEPTRAIQIMEECVHLAEQAGFGVPQFGTRADLGWVYASLGAIEKALELALMAQRNAHRLLMFGSWPLATLARIQLRADNLAAAEETIKQARAFTRPDYFGALYPTISSALAFAEMELALAKSEYAAAIPLAERLINFLERAGIRTFMPEARHLKAQGLMRGGEPHLARDELMAARVAAETLGSRRMLWQILFELSRLETERGDLTAAQALHHQAREIVDYVAAHTPDELRKSFLNLRQVRLVLETPD